MDDEELDEEGVIQLSDNDSSDSDSSSSSSDNKDKRADSTRQLHKDIADPQDRSVRILNFIARKPQHLIKKLPDSFEVGDFEDRFNKLFARMGSTTKVVGLASVVFIFRSLLAGKKADKAPGIVQEEMTPDNRRFRLRQFTAL